MSGIHRTLCVDDSRMMERTVWLSPKKERKFCSMLFKGKNELSPPPSSLLRLFVLGHESVNCLVPDFMIWFPEGSGFLLQKYSILAVHLEFN